ncbi:MAG: hypothetical protein KJ043_12820, partial [Anaerolineae bacterium]|nr:hypothetical protein [Anaerolineae bacterium]
RIDIVIYGKGILPSSQIRKGDLHRYVKELEKEGWYHVYGTGDSEGILAYLERQRITPEKKRESDYIDVKNRHLCDPNTEYCALNLDLDGTPYNGYIVTYHRDQNNTKQLKLTDNGDSVKADLAHQGWKIVHQHLVRGGIYQVIYYERPKQAQKTNTSKSTESLSSAPVAIHPDEWHSIMLGGEQRILQTEANSLFTEIIENGANKRQMGAIKAVFEQSIADGWIHLGTHTSNTKTAYILGRNGQVMSSDHITPAHHTQLPNGIRITLIEDLGGELKVCAYDNQKVDNLRNQKKSLDEFVATMTKNGDWQLVYEAEESGNRVIYLGRVMP